jgi:hypothetical protein
MNPKLKKTLFMLLVRGVARVASPFGSAIESSAIESSAIESCCCFCNPIAMGL